MRGLLDRGAVRCVVLATSQVLARSRRGTAPRPGAARRHGARPSSSPGGPASCAAGSRSTPTRPRTSSRVCARAGRAAAGHRAGRGPGAVDVRAGHRASPRRPLLAPQRPDQSPAGTSAHPRGCDRLELRPPVPRRPTRALGAVRDSPAAPRSTPSSTCSWRWTCRRAPSSTRSAGWSTAPSSRIDAGERRGAVPAPRQHPYLRRRAPDRGRARRRGDPRARRVVRRPGRVV